MAPEAGLWAWMRRGLRPLGVPHDVHRIETDTVAGYPDVEGCIGGTCFLLELKVAHYVRRDGSFALPHFTAKQAYALHRRVEVGGRAWMLIRRGTGHHLVWGSAALDLHDGRLDLTEERIAEWSAPVPAGAKAEYFWRHIARR